MISGGALRQTIGRSNTWRHRAPDATRPGLTLVELVVTLTVLALVVAFVLPTIRTRSDEPVAPPDALARARRAAIHEARQGVGQAPDGRSLAITPWGSCFPDASWADSTLPRDGWDPLTCASARETPIR